MARSPILLGRRSALTGDTVADLLAASRRQRASAGLVPAEGAGKAAAAVAPTAAAPDARVPILLRPAGASAVRWCPAGKDVAVPAAAPRWLQGWEAEPWTDEIDPDACPARPPRPRPS